MQSKTLYFELQNKNQYIFEKNQGEENKKGLPVAAILFYFMDFV